MAVLTTIGNILIALLLLMLMVVIHELGHFLAGKLFNFKINEFAIGFGKPLWKKKFGETQFSIRPIPLGGYCSFGEDDVEVDTDPRAFVNQKPWKRIIVLFSGALFNFISAILIILITFMTYGDTLPVIVEGYTAADGIYVEFDAGNSGLQAGDIILRLDGTQLSFIQGPNPRKAEQTSREFIVRRTMPDGSTKEILLNISLEDINAVNPFIKYSQVKYGLFEAMGKGVVVNFQLIGKLFEVFAGLFTGNTPMSELGGPVTVINTMGEFAGLGLGILLYAVCLISANLAFFNILPLPALDGSRILFVIIEWIRGKPINRNVEATIHFFGLIFLFAFAILVDVIKLF